MPNHTRYCSENEHWEYTLDEWISAVYMRDTELGYHDWVLQKFNKS
jgi:hypothetical protein